MMKRIAIIAWIAFWLLPGFLYGTPHKHWYKDKLQIAGVTFMGAVIAADATSTATRRPGLVESNRILGPNPSNRSVALFSLGYFSIQTGLYIWCHRITHHVPLADGSGYVEDTKKWKFIGYVGVPLTVGIINGHNTVRNYELK